MGSNIEGASDSIGQAYGGYRGFLALRQRGGAGEVANHHVQA